MLERVLCLVRGRHENRLRNEGGRAFLVCEYCGHQSAGWETGVPPAAQSRPDSLRLLFGDGDGADCVDSSVLTPGTGLAPDYPEYPDSFRLLFDR